MANPIPITAAEYQAKFGVTPPLAQNIQPVQTTSAQPIPITAAQYQMKFGTPPPQQSSGILNQNTTDTVNAGANYTKSLVSDYGADANEFVQNTENTANKLNSIQGQGAIGVAKGVGALGENVLQNAGTAIKTIFQPITTGISQFVNYVAGKESDSKTLQGVANNPVVSGGLDQVQNLQNHWNQFSQDNPNTAKDISAAVNVLGALIGEKPAEQGFGAVKQGATDATGAIADTASSVKEALTPDQTPPTPLNPQDPEVAAQLKGVADDWQKPTTINEAKYNKARDVLAQNPSTPQFLAEQGLNPYAHIEDGKYSTESTAQNLRDTAGKMSSDTLRPPLQMADYTTPKTPVQNIVDTTINDIKNGQSSTAGDMQAQIAKAKSEGLALQEKYPDGMSLTNMHDEKITYASNGKYSPVGDTNVNNISSVNRAFGRTLGTAVEETSPKDIPVKKFNSYLSKYYKGADYLDALDGKKAPVSTGQKIAQYGAKILGAKLGSYIPGVGDIVGPIAGYKIGGALEHVIENLTNPMRDTFLRNLKITNPEAFTKVSEFIGKQEAERATQLSLPAGSFTPAPEFKGGTGKPRVSADQLNK